MIFRNIRTDDGWIIVDYTTTWDYGYDFMLNAAQIIIDDDFRDGTQRIAVSQLVGEQNKEILDKVKLSGMKLRDCAQSEKECGVLTIAGISSIMDCPFQLVFFNQTNRVRLFCPVPEYFKQYGDHVFDNYLNSVEIKAYCRAGTAPGIYGR